MKNIFLALGVLGAASASVFAAPASAVHEIKLTTEKSKADNAIHWMPERIEVKQGEHVKFIATHTAPGGFDVHGISIPALKIVGQVNRGAPFTAEATIPETLAPGEYDIICQFHEGHKHSKLVVLADASAKKAPPAKTK